MCRVQNVDAAYLGLKAAKLDEANALEFSRLTVCGQAHCVDCSAFGKSLCQLLTHCLLAQILVKTLDKDGSAL